MSSLVRALPKSSSQAKGTSIGTVFKSSPQVTRGFDRDCDDEATIAPSDIVAPRSEQYGEESERDRHREHDAVIFQQYRSKADIDPAIMRADLSTVSFRIPWFVCRCRNCL